MRPRSIWLLVALALGLLAAPLAADAQQPSKVFRIGVLATARAPLLEAFLQGLRELGYVEGQNIIIEWRFSEGRAEQLPVLAADLVRLKVDLIVASGTPVALPAKNATRTIPIVMVAVRPSTS